MNEKQLKRLIENYLNGNCTEREKTLLDKVLDSYDSPADITQPLEDEHRLQNEIFSKITSEIEGDTSKVPPYPVKKRSSSRWLAVAATILVLIGMGSVYFSEQPLKQVPLHQTEILSSVTDWGQRNTITLSDGTTITLNAGSQLHYPKTFEGNTIRSVSLVGEAFFEVAKNPGKPFIIKTGKVTTRVLGTSFNINSYEFNDMISITVRTGKVQVESVSRSGKTDAVQLVPNEMAQYSRSNDSITKSIVDNDNYMDWKNGIIRFSDITFHEASKMLNRWYGVDISFENEALKKCHVTARYEHAKLQVVLESIKFATKGMDYEFTDQKKILLKGRCQN
ncbi:FecR domain-containing protein [Muricauda ruestringensis]|uniref:FecR domain-containing protein n=1 Tax=Flagellimonas aurea TaxID=2915619 RepID=A0ABS3G9N5_9FLAO|nr:FecR domain-containing protein [Allomuricauda aurea]MBC72131.1 hypothetical protein [Allomuricauda sp.]MBO0355757.1 FecR domain-containing protein [Allomuricauda aurea]|tara:strand:+ start:10430 stop:11437 length:1008 start_codon:yes stop_codon:yes gene_type:complete